MARIKEHFGFDCSGDIRDFTIDDRDYLVEMVSRHKVLRWRNQTLTAQEYLKFSEIFSECWANDDGLLLGGNNESKVSHIESNKITLVSNRETGVLSDREISWHSDVSHKPFYTPGGTTPFRLLYAVTLPDDEQTITRWLDCEYVYNHCPIELRTVCEKLIEFNQADYITSWDGCVSPFVKIDPITHNKSFTIQRDFFKHFIGMSELESKLIMDQLFDIALRPENIITNEWQVGDVILNNNYNTIHQREKFTSTQERTLWRTTFQIDELIPSNLKT